MKTRIFLTAMVLLLAVTLALPQGSWAKAVGRFTQVEGRVDLLKGGKLPAVSVKEGDEVEQGDVLRTKSLSRAQITFVDDSTVTISPQSRIAIEKYMFDSAKKNRNALLEVFYGVVLTAVSKIYQTEQPDFKVKTNTAIMGIRGTQVGIRLAPNSSQFLNFQGITRVSSNYPEVQGHVDLKAMEATEVKRGRPPTLPYEITREDKKLFMDLLLRSDIRPIAGANLGAQPKGSGNSFAAIEAARAAASLNSVVVVPIVEKKLLTLMTYNFTQNFAINYTMGFNGTVANFVSGTTIYGNTSMGKPFTVDFNIFATPTSGKFSDYSSGLYPFTSLNCTGTVSGPPGGVLTGNMNVSASITGSTVNSNFTLSGPVTIQPSGVLSFTPTGTVSVGGTEGNIGTAGVPTSTWTQTPTQTTPATGASAAPSGPTAPAVPSVATPAATTPTAAQTLVKR